MDGLRFDSLQYAIATRQLQNPNTSSNKTQLEFGKSAHTNYRSDSVHQTRKEVDQHLHQ